MSSERVKKFVDLSFEMGDTKTSVSAFACRVGVGTNTSSV